MVNGNSSQTESELQLDRPTPEFPLQVPLNQRLSISPELNGVTPTMESMLDLLNGNLEDLENMTLTPPNAALEVSPDCLLQQRSLILSRRRNRIGSVP